MHDALDWHNFLNHNLDFLDLVSDIRNFLDDLFNFSIHNDSLFDLDNLNYLGVFGFLGDNLLDHCWNLHNLFNDLSDRD